MTNNQSATAERIVLLDNRDSFTYNLVDELRQLGYPLVVYRNHIAAEQLLETLASFPGRQLLCLSPGPGHPAESGNLLAVIEGARGRYPMLGICLGFQALVHASGGRVDRCGETVHGKKALIEHCNSGLFRDFPQPLAVARYHSLAGFDLPVSVDVLAQCGSIPMAAWFSDYHALGFQFHPESILTSHGTEILKRSVAMLFAASPVAEELTTCKP